MVFNSVEEIFAFIDRKREKLVEMVSSLSDEQTAQRRTPDAWSIAEILEHLSIIENSISMAINRLLEKAEAKGFVSENKGILNPSVSLVQEAERAKDAKFQAPESFIPKKAATVSTSLESLKSSRAALHELRSRIEAVNGSEVRFPHPAFGPLNLYQWIAFIGLHEAHHLRQIRETLEK
jgi:uncharacterized damage-inducible protein DinB